jgi:hypothetical protein
MSHTRGSFCFVELVSSDVPSANRFYGDRKGLFIAMQPLAFV